MSAETVDILSIIPPFSAPSGESGTGTGTGTGSSTDGIVSIALALTLPIDCNPSSGTGTGTSIGTSTEGSVSIALALTKPKDCHTEGTVNTGSDHGIVSISIALALPEDCGPTNVFCETIMGGYTDHEGLSFVISDSAWDAATNYFGGELVYVDSINIYESTRPSLNISPPNSTYWNLVYSGRCCTPCYFSSSLSITITGTNVAIQGAWSPSTLYDQGDRVTHGGRVYSYLVAGPVLSTEPPSDEWNGPCDYDGTYTLNQVGPCQWATDELVDINCGGMTSSTVLFFSADIGSQAIQLADGTSFTYPVASGHSLYFPCTGDIAFLPLDLVNCCGFLPDSRAVLHLGDGSDRDDEIISTSCCCPMKKTLNLRLQNGPECLNGLACLLTAVDNLVYGETNTYSPVFIGRLATCLGTMDFELYCNNFLPDMVVTHNLWILNINGLPGDFGNCDNGFISDPGSACKWTCHPFTALFKNCQIGDSAGFSVYIQE